MMNGYKHKKNNSAIAEHATALATLRKKSAQCYEKLHWPTTNSEEYRRTDLSTVPFDQCTGGEIRLNPVPLVEYLDTPYDPIVQIRLSNGAARGRLPSLSSGIIAELVDAPDSLNDKKLQQARLSGGDDYSTNKFSAWNYSLSDHGIALRIPEGFDDPRPFSIEFVYAGENVFWQPQVTVVVERNAQANIYCRYTSQNGGRQLVNTHTNFILEEGARVFFLDLQQMNKQSFFFGHTNFFVHSNTQLHYKNASLGAQLTKIKMTSQSNGEGSDVTMQGLYFTDKNQHHDIYSVQSHNAPHTRSRTDFKGVAQDNSYAVYRGLIAVKEHARETDAYMTNKNIILGKNARTDSIPSLKIDNNDVKCSHGSTISRIRDEELFYLKTRGIPQKAAYEMVIEGFFNELLDNVYAPYRSWIDDDIREKLTH